MVRDEIGGMFGAVLGAVFGGLLFGEVMYGLMMAPVAVVAVFTLYLFVQELSRETDDGGST